MVYAPEPSASSLEDAAVTYSSIGTAPTLTVIVVPVTAVIFLADPEAGSVERGYAF